MGLHADFRDARLAIQRRLFHDPSYDVAYAMSETVAITDRYVTELLHLPTSTTIWAGGSLGRREMLPNSDLDLFLFSSDRRAYPEPAFEGFDHTEIAAMTVDDLATLAGNTLIDLNQIVDGRAVGRGDLDEPLARILEAANTKDRQIANLITEYYFFRYFDFPHKRNVHGPDLKYSSGSSRMILFANFFSRLAGNPLPARRTDGPEFLAGLEVAETLLGVPPPSTAIELIFVVKNAAFSAFLDTRDPRLRCVGRPALSAALERCGPRLRARGIRDVAEVECAYARARSELESYIHQLVSEALARHRSADVLGEIRDTPSVSRAALGVRRADEYPQDEAAILAFTAWQVCLDRPSSIEVAKLAASIMRRGAKNIGGALTAIACCHATPESTLLEVIEWVRRENAGPYIPKIISRRSTASPALRKLSREAYQILEFVEFTT